MQAAAAERRAAIAEVWHFYAGAEKGPPPGTWRRFAQQWGCSPVTVCNDLRKVKAEARDAAPGVAVKPEGK
jgi:hypothetical protein